MSHTKFIEERAAGILPERAPDPTYRSISDRALYLATRYGRELVIGILATFDADRVADLKASQYRDFDASLIKAEQAMNRRRARRGS